MEVTLNTLLCDLVTPDTYGTFNSELFSDGLEPMSDFYKEVFDQDILIRNLREAATSAWACDEVTAALEKCGVKFLSLDDFASPREYNFSTDSFGILFDVDKPKAIKYVNSTLRQSKSAQKYINEHYKSRSGFISLMPDSIDEIIEYIEDDQYRGFAALIMLALNEQLGARRMREIEEIFFEEVLEMESPYYSENILPEDLEQLYNDDWRMDMVYAYMRYQWREYIYVGRFDDLSAQTNGRNDIVCPENGAADLILWAMKRGLSANWLCDMAGVSRIPITYAA